MSYEALLGEDWNQLIGEELSKDYFKELIKKIRSLKETEKVYPETIKDTLQVFRNTSPKTIKIIILGQD